MEYNQANNQQQLRRDDEVDLFDLLKTLWKWRFFVVGITLGVLMVGLAYVVFKAKDPVTYTGKVSIQIGKVANVNIESPGDIYAFLQSDIFVAGDERLRKIEISFNDFKNIDYPRSREKQFQLNNYENFEYTTVITFSYKDFDAEEVLEVARKASSRLKQRHEKIYNNALKKFETFKQQLGGFPDISNRYLPFLLIDSYTYPTRVIRSANAKNNVPQNKIPKILVLVVLFVFFISVMLAFLIEGIRNRIKAERND